MGGGEQHLLRVAEACREWGYRVTVVCLPDSGLAVAARDRGLDVSEVRMRGNWGQARDRLAAALSLLAPDIVHTHGFRVMLTGLDAARRAGVPHVLTTVHNMPSAPVALHPGWRGVTEYRVRRWLWRKTFRHTERFVCVVDGVRRELEGMGLSPDRTIVIPNGIPDPLRDGRTYSGHASPLITLTSVGRLEALKDFGTLVAAAVLVVRECGDVRFRLVGDGSLRASLERQARELGILDRFEFVGWSEDPLAEIAASDIYAVSSVTDTTNLTVLEAMALARPVVATAVGGIPDAVVEGVTGRLVPPRDPEALATAIIDLASHGARRQQMGDAGRKRFESEFTLQRMLDAHRELYEQIIGQPG